MPAIERKKVYSPLNGGINDRVNPLLIRDSQASELQNVVLNKKGILQKIEGFTVDHSPFPNNSDSFIRMLLNYKRGTSVDDLLMMAQDNGNANALFKVDLRRTTGDGNSDIIGHTVGTADFINGNTAVTGTGTVWLTNLKAGDKIKANSDPEANYTEIASVNSDISITLVGGGYLGATSGGDVVYTGRIIWHKDFVPRSTVFNDKAIITNGSDTTATWDNSTLDLIADVDAPTAKFIEIHKNRVFLANSSSGPSRLFWSSVNNEQIWDPVSVEDIFPQDNGTIISIISFADSLIVLKNNGRIYQVVGNFDDSVEGTISFIRKIDGPQNLGIIAERSPVIHNGFLYFLSETGIYRIDARLVVQKVTFNLDDFIDNINFSLGPTSAKSFSLDTNVDFNNGTHVGTVSRAGILQPYFDQHSVSDATKGPSKVSVYTDITDNTHVTYIDTSGNIKYVRLDAATGVVLTETAIDAPTEVTKVSIAVAPNGNVGILYMRNSTTAPTGLGFVNFIERISGTWGSEEFITTTTAVEDLDSDVDVVYNPINEPRGVFNTGTNIRAIRRLGAVWQAPLLIEQANLMSFSSIAIAPGGDLAISYTRNDTGTAGAASRTSTNGGLTYAPTEPDINSSGSVLRRANMATAQFDSTGDQFTAIYFAADGTGAQLRNHTTTSTTVLDAAAISVFGHGFSAIDTSTMYYLSGTAPNQVEKVTFEDTLNVQNSVLNLIDSTDTGTENRPSRGMHNNGNTSSFASFGTNANEVFIRRVAFRSIYTSQEFSDSSLTQWGLYEIDGQIDNSATVLHEIALNTVSPPTVFNTIVDNQIISSNAANSFIIDRVTFTLNIFAGPELDSITMNYTGTGVDAKQPLGISFQNELFYAAATKSATENDTMVISDIIDSLLKTTYGVSAMEVYKNKIYAGHSARGDLIKLLDGFNFDGVAYAMDFQSKEDMLETIEQEKDIFKYYVLYEVKGSGTFDFSFRLNNFATAGGSLYKTVTIDQTVSGPGGIAEIPVGEKAKSVQWRVQNNNTDEEVGIIAVVIVYGFLNLR